MVLSLDYDKSLWFILKNDKKNRKKILDFLKRIPSNLYMKLLDRIRNNLIVDECNEEIVNGIVYYYSIDSQDGSISLGAFHKKDVSENDIFMIKLYPFRDVNEDKKYVSIGSMLYLKKDSDNNNIIDGGKYEYSLIKKNNKVDFVIYDKYGVFITKRKKKVNLCEIPSTVSLESFDKNKNHALIRKINEFIKLGD